MRLRITVTKGTMCTIPERENIPVGKEGRMCFTASNLSNILAAAHTIQYRLATRNSVTDAELTMCIQAPCVDMTLSGESNRVRSTAGDLTKVMAMDRLQYERHWLVEVVIVPMHTMFTGATSPKISQAINDYSVVIATGNTSWSRSVQSVHLCRAIDISIGKFVPRNLPDSKLTIAKRSP